MRCLLLLCFMALALPSPLLAPLHARATALASTHRAVPPHHALAPHSIHAPGIIVLPFTCATRGAAAPCHTSAISNTVDMTQVLSVAGGQTTVEVARQVVSGGHLSLFVRTVPHALVTIVIGFADGTSFVLRRRASGLGTLLVIPLIAYQPQGSTEMATLTVQARLLAANLNDTVQGSITVLQHINLMAALLVPRTVVAGHSFTITVVTTPSLPDVLVRLRLTYPDGRSEWARSGYTDASGTLATTLTASAYDGTSGALWIQAVLSYGGVSSATRKRIVLRASS